MRFLLASALFLDTVLCSSKVEEQGAADEHLRNKTGGDSSAKLPSEIDNSDAPLKLTPKQVAGLYESLDGWSSDTHAREIIKMVHEASKSSRDGHLQNETDDDSSAKPPSGIEMDPESDSNDIPLELTAEQLKRIFEYSDSYSSDAYAHEDQEFSGEECRDRELLHCSEEFQSSLGNKEDESCYASQEEFWDPGSKGSELKHAEDTAHSGSSQEPPAH